VYHFVASGFREETEFAEGSGASLSADLEFLYRAAKKVQQIREDLGKVGPVIAEQVEEAMLGKRRRLDTARAERENEPVKRLLRFEQNIRELSRRHADQLDETRRDLHLTPANIEAVVHIALDLARPHLAGRHSARLHRAPIRRPLLAAVPDRPDPPSHRPAAAHHVRSRSRRRPR